MRCTLTLMFLMTLSACGPEKSGSDDTGSDTGHATDTSGGSDTGTPTGSDTGTPTTGEPLSCDAFQPQPPEAFKPVAITIVSELAEPVWIGAAGCGSLPLLRILDADAQDIFEIRGSCYPVLCHEFLGSEDCTLGCDDCAGAVARRVGPGSKLTLNWSAARGVPMQMTDACASGESCQRECLRPEPVAAGDYKAELTVFRACTGGCACDEDDPNASCPLWDPLETSDPFDVTATFAYPATDALELVLTEP